MLLNFLKQYFLHKLDPLVLFQVKPLLSVSSEDARIRVLSLYKVPTL